MESLPLRYRALARGLALAVRALACTWRVRWTDRAVLREALAAGPVIAAFHHEDQLPLVALCRGLGFAGMASLSADGALLAGVIERLGYGVLRGSSSRGGMRAARAAARRLALGEGSVALAVDGPRGPRRVPQPGVLGLARSSGRPIVCLAVRARWAWRARSWDRFLLPLPFARVELRCARFESPLGTGTAREASLGALQALLGLLAGEDGTPGSQAGIPGGGCSVV